MQQALVASGSTTDVVLMTTPDVYAHLGNDDKTQWSDIVLVPRLPNPYDDTGTKSRHVFTKLQAWSLTQYDDTAVAQAHTHNPVLVEGLVSHLLHVGADTAGLCYWMQMCCLCTT